MDIKVKFPLEIHHHNSIRFRCTCGQLHFWKIEGRRMKSESQLLEDWVLLIICKCGKWHTKKRANFSGEWGGKT